MSDNFDIYEYDRWCLTAACTMHYFALRMYFRLRRSKSRLV